MKSAIRVILFSIFVAIFSGLALTKASDYEQPVVNSWEAHPEGISSALLLTSKRERGVKKWSIEIHIKSTSKNFVADSINSGFKLFSLNSGGTWQPLRTLPAQIEVSAASFTVKPGQEISYPIQLSPEELELVKAHPVKCSITLFDGAGSNRHTIESSQQQLSETTVQQR
jgi:hypothetical protein